jgi:hypothetical protein
MKMLLYFLCITTAFATNKDDLIKNFDRLPQDQKASTLAVMLDSIEHEMYGVAINKSMDDLKKYGGLPGYYLNHYATQTSGGLLMPIFRVYDVNGKLVETLAGGTLSNDGKTLLNLGGFSDPISAINIKIHDEKKDIDAVIRREVMNTEKENITANKKYYTPQYIKSLKSNNFINRREIQDVLSGSGYDRHTIDTVVRETQEEAGIKINPNEMILLQVGSEIIQQKTKRDYTIYAQSIGIGYFMMEFGSVYLDKNGKIDSIKINDKAILNKDDMMKTFDKENFIFKGYDDGINGVVFIKLSSLKKIVDKDKPNAFFYTANLWNDNEVKTRMMIGNAASFIPKDINYNACGSVSFETFGIIYPSQNSINTHEQIDKRSVKILCNKLL